MPDVTFAVARAYVNGILTKRGSLGIDMYDYLGTSDQSNFVVRSEELQGCGIQLAGLMARGVSQALRLATSNMIPFSEARG